MQLVIGVQNGMITRSKLIDDPGSQTPIYIATPPNAHLRTCTLGCESRGKPGFIYVRKKPLARNLCGIAKKLVHGVCEREACSGSVICGIIYRKKTIPPIFFKNQRH